MIIVNQCKTLTINFANVTRIKVRNYNSEFYVVCDFPNGAYEDLGIYETKERAKEVLKEINARYENWQNLLAGQPQGECSPKYEMPLE